MGLFISVMDPEWQKMLRNSQFDFYHLPGYASIEAQLLRGEAMAYYHREGNNRMLVPLIRRQIPGVGEKLKEWYDAGSPYGYPGILVNKKFDRGRIDDFLERYREDAKDQQLVTTVIRLNPYYNNMLFRETEHITQVQRGDTVWVDLRRGPEALFSSFSKNHRNNIKSLLQNGFKVVRGNWGLYRDFVKMYYATMSRNDAADYYYFDEHYFLMLNAVLGKCMELFIIKDPSGEPCCGGIFTCFNQVVQSHLVATREEYLHLAPVKLVFFEAMKWGRGRHCNWMNMGGGRGLPGDSLLQFKQGFSKVRKKYCTLQIVHDPVKYQNLLQQHGKMPEQQDFFPLYRAGITRVTANGRLEEAAVLTQAAAVISGNMINGKEVG